MKRSLAVIWCLLTNFSPSLTRIHRRNHQRFQGTMKNDRLVNSCVCAYPDDLPVWGWLGTLITSANPFTAAHKLALPWTTGRAVGATGTRSQSWGMSWNSTSNNWTASLDGTQLCLPSKISHFWISKESVPISHWLFPQMKSSWI